MLFMEHTNNICPSELSTEKPNKKARLSDRQKAFIDNYVKTLNATQAALSAGYAESGARVQGYRMLTNPYIREKIDEALEQRSEECKIDTNLIIGSLKDIALNQFILPKDRVKALDLLGRYKGLWSGEADKAMPSTITVTLKED